MIREIDHKIYNRYKDGHDGSMDKYLEWYESGGRRPATESRERSKDERLFNRLTERIKQLREDYSGTQIARMLGVGRNLVYQLSYGNHNCSKETATEIIKRINDEEMGTTT